VPPLSWSRPLPARLSNKKSYIATDDGGYVSASDVEDDFALQTNNAGDLDDDDDEVFGSEHMEEYSTKTYVVQWILSAQVDTSEKLQRHNLFQIFFVVKDYRVCTIIDRGSCNNFVSADFRGKDWLKDTPSYSSILHSMA
jgi:hypothetical protein